MCERARLFLPEAKAILHDLLTRTLELVDLSLRFLEHFRLSQFLLDREQQRTERYFSLHRPCRLNYNVRGDLERYLLALRTSCRLVKSRLRSLHAARVVSTKDYVVVDDEIYELIALFKSKLSPLQLASVKDENLLHRARRRHHAQRLVQRESLNHTFTFYPQSSTRPSNFRQASMSSAESEEYDAILQSFKKIAQFYHFLCEKFYGAHTVRESDEFQPIVVSIIRLLLSITARLKEKLPPIAPVTNHHTYFRAHEEVCHEEDKPTFRLIEIPVSHDETLDARNANHPMRCSADESDLWEFDAEEFNRLANLDSDS